MATPPGVNGQHGQIVEIMDEAGVDTSIVFAMCTTTKRSIEMAEEAVAEYPNRLIPFAYACRIMSGRSSRSWSLPWREGCSAGSKNPCGRVHAG